MSTPAPALPSLLQRILLSSIGLMLVLSLVTAWFTHQRAEHETSELLDAQLMQYAGLLLNTEAAMLPDPTEEEKEALETHEAHEALDVHTPRENHGKPHDASDAHNTRPNKHLSPHQTDKLSNRYTQRRAYQIWIDGELAHASNHFAQISSADNAANNAASKFTAVTSGFATEMGPGGKPWRVYAAQSPDGHTLVLVGDDQSERLNMQRLMLWGVVWPLLACLVLLSVGLVFIIKHSLAPINLLGQHIDQRTSSDHSALPEHLGVRELHPVLKALNQLFARQSQHMAQERRFIADAAHELRTPIAIVRSHTEVAMNSINQHLDKHTANAAQHSALALQGCDRAGHLIDQMLTLSRLDAHSPESIALQDCDWTAIARGVLQDTAPLALEKNQELELLAPPHLHAPSHAPWLAILLRNLLDNAMRYSPEQAHIRVTLSLADAKASAALGTMPSPQQAQASIRQPQHPMICIEDSGAGLAPEMQAQLGARFVRGEHTRTGNSGSGLGWSIVLLLAKHLQLKVQTSKSASLGGLRVDITPED